jgi:hypothetical protein
MLPGLWCSRDRYFRIQLLRPTTAAAQLELRGLPNACPTGDDLWCPSAFAMSASADSVAGYSAGTSRSLMASTDSIDECKPPR